MQHFQRPLDLPMYSEIFEQEVDSDGGSDIALSSASSSSIHTLCRAEKPSLAERQRKLDNKSINIGRAIKIGMIKILKKI